MFWPLKYSDDENHNDAAIAAALQEDWNNSSGDDDDEEEDLPMTPTTRNAQNHSLLSSEPPSSRLDNIHVGQSEIRIGQTVELKPLDCAPNGSFFRIEQILKRPNGIILCGHLFRRSIELPVGHHHINEVVLYRTLVNDGCSLLDYEKLFEIKTESLRLVHGCPVLRNLVVTSDAYPAHNPESVNVSDPQTLKANGQLVCRMTMLVVYTTKRGSTLFANVITHVRPSKADAGYANDIVSELHHPIDLNRAKRRDGCTYASGFCGLGGDVTGATIAGCKVQFAWDHWQTACETLQKNHPKVHVRCAEHDKVFDIFPGYWLDILHLSCPCQFFSACHTRAGKNDDANSAALLATGAHVEEFRPLVLTMENTSNLKGPTHKIWLDGVVSDLVDRGYNIQWRVVQFLDYGLPASRKRLIMFASRKEIPIPDFPKPSHGPPGSGRRPYATIFDALHAIPEDAAQHLSMAKWFPTRKPPYDPHIQAKCLTTTKNDGGGNMPYHWSGRRDFTPRDRAKLQGFQLNYILSGTEADQVKLLGNAVPPSVWSLFVGSIMKTLADWRAGRIDDEGKINLAIYASASVEAPNNLVVEDL
jgi:site-specific DNA-cytosine methylase